MPVLEAREAQLQSRNLAADKRLNRRKSLTLAPQTRLFSPTNDPARWARAHPESRNARGFAAVQNGDFPKCSARSCRHGDCDHGLPLDNATPADRAELGSTAAKCRFQRSEQPLPPAPAQTLNLAFERFALRNKAFNHVQACLGFVLHMQI
jgi:hypothetical protein